MCHKKRFSIEMNSAKHIIMSFLAICSLNSCHLLDTDCRDMLGRYVSISDETIEDDIVCNVHLEMTEDFGIFSFSNNVEMQATFILDDAINFPNLTLTYQISVDGNWNCCNNTLTVSVDTTTFCCNYIGSSAKSPTEESMVRQIRKNIIAGELMPRIREEVIASTQRCVKIIERKEDKIVVEHPVTKLPVAMIRVD